MIAPINPPMFAIPFSPHTQKPNRSKWTLTYSKNIPASSTNMNQNIAISQIHSITKAYACQCHAMNPLTNLTYCHSTMGYTIQNAILIIETIIVTMAHDHLMEHVTVAIEHAFGLNWSNIAPGFIIIIVSNVPNAKNVILI